MELFQQFLLDDPDAGDKVSKVPGLWCATIYCKLKKMYLKHFSICIMSGYLEK